MALGGNRRIEIDIVANDQSSRVYDHVASSMQGMAGRINNSITGVNKSLQQYNNAMTGMYRSTQVAVAGAGYLLYRFTKDSINAFADFERQHGKTMGAIASNYDKTTASQQKFIEDQKKLKDESLKLGTVGPTGRGTFYNPSQVSYAQTEMAKAGAKPEGISNALPTLLKFAGGNDLPIDTATEYAVNISEMFKIPASKWGEMLDKVTRAADVSTISVPDIFETLKYAGPTASALGRGLDETLSMIAVMGNAGLKGSIAGTGINAFYTRLLSPIGKSEKQLETAPTPYSQQALKTFIDETTDSNGKFKDTATVTAMLDQVMGSMNDREQAWFAQKLFGMFQMKAGYVLADNGGDKLRGVTDDIMKNAPGTNDRKWDIMLNTSWGKQQAFKNMLTGTKTDVGYRLAPLTNSIIDELFNVLSNKGNYKINFDSIAKGIQDSSDLITQQYGEQLGQAVKTLGNFSVSSVRVAGANEPLVEGALSSLGRLLSGDVSGAIDEMGKSVGRANDNIKDLPPDLQGMAREARNAALALMALAGINFAAKLLENITTIWRYTLGNVIKTANMNVNAATVVLKDTGLIDKDGKPIYKAEESGQNRSGGTGSGGSKSGGSPVILGPNGQPISSDKTTQQQPKPGTLYDSHGNPLTAGTSTPTKSSLGPRISTGINVASWAYAIGEMTGANDWLLDKMNVGGNSRDNVDRVRTGLNWGLTANFADDLLLKGAGKKVIGNAGKSVAGGVSSSLGPISAEIGTAGTIAGTSLLAIGAAAFIKGMKDDKMVQKQINDSGVGQAVVLDTNHPAWDPNGILTGRGKPVNVDELVSRNGVLGGEIRQKSPSWWQSLFSDGSTTASTSDKSAISSTFLSTVGNINKALNEFQSPTVNVAPPTVNVDVKVDSQGNVQTNKYITSTGPTLDNLFRLQRSRMGGHASE